MDNTKNNKPASTENTENTNTNTNTKIKPLHIHLIFTTSKKICFFRNI